MKKLFPLCLALVLALALAIPAAASDAASQPAGVAVQVNGENVTFPNASPEVTNGRTMVPMRAVLETLGATVDYAEDTRTVTATLGDVSLTHVIDTNTIEMGDGEQLTMDTTSYVTKGSTLVPLRFFSQALGYEVYWDEGQRTAVVIDKASFISELDAKLTVINGFEAETAEDAEEAEEAEEAEKAEEAEEAKEVENAAMDVEASGTLKMLDGSSDDELSFSLKATALVSDKAVNMSGSMDLSSLAGVMEVEAEGSDEADYEKFISMLDDLTFEIIGSEGLWLKVPALNVLIPDVDEDAWLKTDDFDMAAVMAVSATDSLADETCGSILYQVVEYMDSQNPVNIYRDLKQAANIVTILVGDDTFTKDGDDCTWELSDAAKVLLATAVNEDLESYPITMKVNYKADGSSFDMELKIAEAVEMTMSGKSSDTSASVELKLTIADVCEMTYECTATEKESDTAPVTAPPAGAKVVDLDEAAEAPETAAETATDDDADADAAAADDAADTDATSATDAPAADDAADAADIDAEADAPAADAAA